MRRHFILAAILMCVSLGGAAAEPLAGPVSLWADIWTNGSQVDTNFESNFGQEKKLPLLGRWDGKLGISLPLTAGFRVMPYGAIQGVTAQDKNYWNNNYAIGYGVRVMPFRDFQAGSPSLAWIPDTRFFWERLSIQYLQNGEAASQEASRDDRFGVEIWHEWNEPQMGLPPKPYDLGQPWVEIWGNFSYRETNFSSQPFLGTLGFFQSKTGIYLKGPIKGMILEPYLKLDVVFSGKSYYWQNIVSPGMGIRFHPFRFQTHPNFAGEIANKFRVFAEISSIQHLKDKPPPGVPTTDFRTGIELAFGR